MKVVVRSDRNRRPAREAKAGDVIMYDDSAHLVTDGADRRQGMQWVPIVRLCDGEENGIDGSVPVEIVGAEVHIK